ncbi:septum formation family protein, partial [Sinomonas sp. G460-2]|uniref:septum formation family protein n=1 Tax=Sinomonas sp. G460-2 TaxID=3393464 RepID=UPI0039F0850A
MTSVYGPQGHYQGDQQAAAPRQPPLPGRPRRINQRRRFRATPWGRITTVGGAVVVLLILWALVATLTAKHGGPEPLAEGVTSASKYAVGDCFPDFDASADTNRAVSCTDAHSAQLVATATYAATDAYPGKESLDTRAAELCRQTKLNLPKDTSNLKQRTVVPTQEGWTGGDRRVDCFVEST